MNMELVKAQYDAVMGCAAGIEDLIDSSPEILKPGLELSVMCLRRTAEGMLLEAMYNA